MDYAATFCVVTSEELYHHGILGMRWGRRNGPPYPLGSGDHSASERRAGWRKSLAPGSPAKRGGGGGGSDGPQAKVKTKKPDVKKEKHIEIETDKKEDNKEAKKEAKKEDKKKDKEGSLSNHKKNLIEKYEKQGMTEADAKKFANKQVKIEKIALVAGTVAVAAIAGYAAYKYRDYSVDKIIKAGSELARMDKDGAKMVHDVFYAANNKKDKAKYIGIYGAQLRQNAIWANFLNGVDGLPNVYQKTIKATQNLKIASDKSALKVLQNRASTDKQFLQEVKDIITNRTLGAHEAHVQNAALRAIEQGRIDKNVYKALNNRLVFRDDAATKKFYDALKKAGYDGLRDTNDRFFSGYKSKNPLIVFNNGKTFVDKVRTVDTEEILNTGNKVRTQMKNEEAAKDFVKAMGKTSGIIGAGVGVGGVGSYEAAKAMARAKGKTAKQNSDRARAAARTRGNTGGYHPYLNNKKKKR